MPKTILMSALLSVSLFAGNITFENAPSNLEHRLPNGKNEILSFHDILKDSMNAVVNISTKTIVQNNQSYNRLFDDPFFRHFLVNGIYNSNKGLQNVTTLWVQV